MWSLQNIQQQFLQLQNQKGQKLQQPEKTQTATVVPQQVNDTTTQINNLVAQSASALTCGPTCQQQQKTDQLKQNYVNAQTNVDTAPTQLDTAEKNYITYTEGTAGYNKVLSSKVTAQSTALTAQTATAFTDAVDNAQTLLDTYNSLHSSYTNSFDLYNSYLTVNELVDGQINSINTDVVTSDRKSYYEGQGVDNLNKWYSFLKWIYIIAVFVFFICIFLTPSSYSFIFKIFILICFIIYPFVIIYIIAFAYNSISKIKELLPKNAYINL